MRWSDVVDFLFPAACVECDAVGEGLCARCFPAAAPLQFDLGGLHCSALGPYCGPLRHAVLALKSGRRDVAEALGIRLSPYVVRARDVAAVVPVPTTVRRRRQRGFDQAELLARIAARDSGLPVVAALAQTAGDAQHGRSRKERLAAVGRFAYGAASLASGMRVLLLDDVVTTGSSLRDCQAALGAAGIRVPAAIVVARADR